jgi:hypothetical protein
LAALPTVNVRVSSTAPANATHVIPDNFIGISYELSSFDTLCESFVGGLLALGHC